MKRTLLDGLGDSIGPQRVPATDDATMEGA